MEKFVKENAKLATKGFKSFLQLANFFQISSTGEEVKESKDLPLIDGDSDVLLAIVIQNLMQPKNAQRRDAITNKKYVEVMSVGDATTFLHKALEEVLRSKIQAMGKVLGSEAGEKLTKRGLSLFVTAPDVHCAAAILASKRFTIQERTEFFDALINAAGTPGCPDYERKLALLNMEYYHGRRMYANGFKLLDERNAFLRPIHFKAWTDLVTKRKILTKAQFV